MSVKAIPSMDKSKLSDYTLQLALSACISSTTVREKLAYFLGSAAEKLTFSRTGSSLTLTAYPLLPDGDRTERRDAHSGKTPSLPPMGKTSVKLPADAGSTITYRTINDYGALTPKMNGVLR